MKTPIHQRNRSISRIVSCLFLILICIPAGYSQENKEMWRKGEARETEQGISLLGKPLLKPALNPEAIQSLTGKYNIALENFRSDPGNPEAHIWLGRRLAYLGNFTKAIRVFSDGIYFFPSDARFYRHRGHRYITIRKLDFALEDFEKAAKLIEGKKDKIEPDGAPNAAGIPVSSLHSNIWYHLGLTQYLLEDFEGAFKSYERLMLSCLRR